MGKYVKKVAFLVLVLLLFVAVLFLVQKEKDTASHLPKITVSTFALYDIVKHVGGNNIDVEMVIPFGVEVHSFEPTPKTIIEIQKSRLFLYSGADLEPWVSNMVEGENLRDMSRYVHLIKPEEEADEEEHHHHHHNAVDPHYWLDVNNMKLLAKKVASELMVIDPQNSALYHQRAEGYIQTLTDLDAAYTERLQHCKVRSVILHHNILGYVAERYDFTVEPLTGLSPDALADAQTMADLSKSIKEKGIKVLFFEAFVSDRMMHSLASENGIAIDYLEPLANITALQAKAQMSYVEGMQTNLEKLARAMECE
jgi:zinc transport system substrate-binding protein